MVSWLSSGDTSRDEVLTLLGDGWGKLTNIAPTRDVRFSQEVEAALVVVAEWERVQVGGAEFEAWSFGRSWEYGGGEYVSLNSILYS